MNRIFFTALSGAFALNAWSATACETLHAYRIQTDDGGYALCLNGVSNHFNTISADLRIRRNARDPSLPDPSTRSSRISKIVDKNSVFRPTMRFLSAAKGYPSL